MTAPGRLAAILAADVVGSPRLIGGASADGAGGARRREAARVPTIECAARDGYVSPRCPTLTTPKNHPIAFPGHPETRKIAAILVADIVGCSRLAGGSRTRRRRRLARLRALRGRPHRSDHHRAPWPRCQAHRRRQPHRIPQRRRRGSLAVEVQNGLVERNAGVPSERRIEFRVGIHLGDVVEESDGDLIGDGVDVAARLEGSCEPGADVLSEDAYRQIKGRLPCRCPRSRAADPVRVYSLEVGQPVQAKPGPALASEKSPRPA